MAAAVMLSTACQAAPAEENTTIAAQEGVEENQDTQTETAEKRDEISLEEFMESAPDSLIHHLYYDVLHSPDSTEDMDEGVTYTFSKDENGKRDGKMVSAHYTKLETENASPGTLVNQFITDKIPEFAVHFDKYGQTDAEKEGSLRLKFTDYDLTLIPDEDLKGLVLELKRTS